MPTDFRALARQKATKYGLLPDVFERQIEAESGFNPKAVSSAGARGIAQIMPSTAKGWGVNPDDPQAALEAAAKNMAGYVKTYGGMGTTDPTKVRGAYEKALQAYNAGPGSVGRYLPSETKGYISKIVGPEKFSFTEALQGQPAQQTAPTQQPGGRTFIVLADQKAEPKSFLGDYISNLFAGGMPKVQSGLDPASLLTRAMFQAPDYLGGEK